MEAGFFALDSFFSPPVAFFGFSGASFHKTLTWMDDVKTRKSLRHFRNTHSGHGILGGLSWIGLSPDRKLCLYKEVIGTGNLLRLWFGI